MPDLCVPELALHAEAVQLAAALPQPVEVLLARERKTGPHAPPPRRPAHRLRRHAAVDRLSKQPGAGGVEEREAHGTRGDLHAEVRRGQAQRLSIGELEFGPGPLPRLDAGRRGRIAAGSPSSTRTMRGLHTVRVTDEPPLPNRRVDPLRSNRDALPRRLPTCHPPRRTRWSEPRPRPQMSAAGSHPSAHYSRTHRALPAGGWVARRGPGGWGPDHRRFRTGQQGEAFPL